MMFNNFIGKGIHKNSKIENARLRNKSRIHECLRFSMRMSRWAGFFPVEGLDKSTISGLRYNLRGFYSTYYIFTLLTGSLTTIFIFLWLFGNELSLSTVTDFIFYTTGFTSMVIFAHLSKKWPMFIRKVTKIEHQLQEIRTSNNTHKYCNIIVALVMIAALVEHILSVVFNAYLAIQCRTSSNKLSEIFKEFFIVNSPHYFQFLPYNHFAGVIFKVVNVQVTFLWSFSDVMTICFSIYLISHFQDLNRVVNNRLKNKNNLTWEQLRVHHARVVELVKLVNARLSAFILQSFVTSIFYICTQLFHTLKTSQSKISDCNDDTIETIRKIRHSPIYSTYYVYSFLFLLVRFVITSLLAANVSIIAKKPLIALDTVPSPEYRLEVQRFRMQIERTPVAMSGLFFYVTRPMLLQVVGSIITYELVMLQLH